MDELPLVSQSYCEAGLKEKVENIFLIYLCSLYLHSATLSLCVKTSK